ncbi:hypothetical protein [Geodermatophilus sp. SYSU D00815]
MDGLTTALDAMAADDLHALADCELLDRTRELVTLRSRIDAELSRTVRVAQNRQSFEHDGARTGQAWLRGHCRLSNAAATQLVPAEPP